MYRGLASKGYEIDVAPDGDEALTIAPDQPPNLVENALRYKLAGGRVDLQLVRDLNQGALVIGDTGLGTADKHLPHIFERSTELTKRARDGMLRAVSGSRL